MGGDNIANVQRITVVADPANANGSAFGGIRAGNAAFVGSSGVVGISAANVAVQDVVTIGDIYATGSAFPSLAFGANSQFGTVTVAGGDLLQGDSKTIANSGYKYDVVLAAGTTSGGAAIAAANTYAQLSFTQNPASVVAALPGPVPTGKTFNLTGGVDDGVAFTGTVANDTFVASGATLTTLDDLRGGAGTDTLAFTDQTAAPVTVNSTAKLTGIELVTLRSADDITANFSGANVTGLETVSVLQAVDATITAGKSTAVSISGATGLIVVDGGSSATIAADTAGQSVTVGGTTVGTGAVSITHTNQVAGNIAIDGGTSVGVTASKATTGQITVGQGGAADGTDRPTGAVTITTTGVAYDAGSNADATRGAITVTGGTTVKVTQTATSDASAVTADTSANTITQGAVTVTGSALTTAVEVTQSAALAARNAVLLNPVGGGSRETAVIAFPAMAATETVTVNGLTFTASKALTSTEVAAAFAGLANGARIGTAPASQGVYSGTFGGGAAGTPIGSTSGVTTVSDVGRITYTSSSNTNHADIAVSDTAAAGNVTATVTNGVVDNSADVVSGRLGVVGGQVIINGAITGADVLSTVTLSAWGNGSTITSDALTTLNLSNSGQDLTVTNAAATTLALGLNAVSVAAVANDIDLGGKYETLNVTASGANSSAFITAGGVKVLTIAGDKTVTLDGSISTVPWSTSLAALETIAITGSAGLTWTGANGATVKSIDTTGTTGSTTVTMDASRATFTGGAGVDAITLSSTTVSKAVNLGDGNDTLTLASGTTSLTATINGGGGTDVLVLRAADAASISTSDTFEMKMDSFERIEIAQVPSSAGAISVNLANLDDVSYVLSNGIAAPVAEEQIVTFNALKAGQSVTVAGRTVTATGADLSPAQIEAVFTSGTTAGAAVVSGSLASNWAVSGSGTATDGAVKLTFSGGAVDALTGTVANAAAPVTPAISNVVQGVTATNEVTTVTFGGLIAGESVTVGDKTVSATAVTESTTVEFKDVSVAANGTDTITLNGVTVSLAGGQTGATFGKADIASAFISGTTTAGLTIAGTNGALYGVSAVQGDTSKARYTSTIANTNVADLGKAGTVASDVTLSKTDGSNGNMTGTQVAAAIAAAGVTGWVATGTNNVVTFTASAAGAATDLAVSSTGAVPSVQKTDGLAAVTERATVTFGDLLSGQSVTAGGRTVTATPVTESASIVFSGFVAGDIVTINGQTVTVGSGGATDAEVAETFAKGTSIAGKTSISGSPTGQYTNNWTPNATTVVFTSTTASADVTDLASAGTAAAKAQVTVTQGRSGNLTGAEVAAAMAGGTSGAAVVTDAGHVWTGTAAGPAVGFVSTSAGSNVTDLVAAATLATAPTAPTVSTSVEGGVRGSLAFTNLANNGTVELKGAADNGTTTIGLADATGTGDVLNLRLTLSGDMNHGTVAAAGVETINLTASDTSTSAINTHSVILNTAAATSIVVNGNANLTLSPSSTTPALSSLDASTLSGKLTASTNGTVAQRITGGGGADTLTARGDGDVLIGGNGNDRLNTSTGADLVVLTGGAGTDTFGVGFAPTNVSSYATITDLSAGESLVFSGGAASFSAAQITLAPTAVFQDYANAAINNSATGAVTWFQFGGDTYIVEKVSAGSVFVNGTDIIVKISGLVNLSGSSFSSTSDTLIYRPTP